MPEQSTIEKIPKVVAQTIDVISQKLSAPASDLFTALAHLAWAEGLTGVILAGCALAVATLAARALFRRLRKDPREFGDVDGVACFICGASAALLIVFGIMRMSSALPRLLAPEGAALVQILGRVF